VGLFDKKLKKDSLASEERHLKAKSRAKSAADNQSPTGGRGAILKK
jgi:hypothetical protein